jgi:hypothetical protein
MGLKSLSENIQFSLRQVRLFNQQSNTIPAVGRDGRMLDLIVAGTRLLQLCISRRVH